MPSTIHLPSSTVPADSVFDALPDAAVLLDESGQIVSANRTWVGFTTANGGDPALCGPGTNYLTICDEAAPQCPEAAQVAADIRAALDGLTYERNVEYPCHSPKVDRWFLTRTCPVQQGYARVLVAHTNITRHKTAELALQHQSRRDALTGLCSRDHFEAALRATLAPANTSELTYGHQNTNVGLLYLEIQDLASINRTYGFALGDEILMKLAERLVTTAQHTDIVARLSDIEFAMIRQGANLVDLNRTMAQLLQKMRRPFVINQHRVSVKLAIGAHSARRGDNPGHALQIASQRTQRGNHTLTIKEPGLSEAFPANHM